MLSLSSFASFKLEALLLKANQDHNCDCPACVKPLASQFYSEVDALVVFQLLVIRVTCYEHDCIQMGEKGMKQ